MDRLEIAMAPTMPRAAVAPVRQATVAVARGGVVALALLFALAGCSDNTSGVGDGLPAEPPLGPVPQLLATAGVQLPVEEYLPTAEQRARLNRARLTLIRRCMERFGIEYTITSVDTGAYGPRSLVDRRYGITDADVARTSGYGLGPRDPALLTRPARPEIGADGANVLSGQGRSVVHGLPVPHGGCIGEADRILNRSVPNGADTARGNQLHLLSFERSKRDSRVRAVFAAWSACMAEAGLHYSDPLAAAADPAFAEDSTAEEVTVALVDIHCKARTNLVGTWFAAERAYQLAAIASDPDGFAATKEAIVARDRAAAETR